MSPRKLRHLDGCDDCSVDTTLGYIYDSNIQKTKERKRLAIQLLLFCVFKVISVVCLKANI